MNNYSRKSSPFANHQQRFFAPNLIPNLIPSNETTSSRPPNKPATSTPFSYMRMFKEELRVNEEKIRNADQNPPEIKERNIRMDDTSSFCFSRQPKYEPLSSFLPNRRFVAASRAPCSGNQEKNCEPQCYKQNDSPKEITEKATEAKKVGIWSKAFGNKPAIMEKAFGIKPEIAEKAAGSRKVETWSKALCGKSRPETRPRKPRRENLADFDIDAMLNEDLPEYRKRRQLRGY